MTVFFNDISIVTSSETLASLLNEQGLNGKTGIAVALNQEVIAKAEWPTTSISENDKILIITATQGG